jgi:hypothetical protein
MSQELETALAGGVLEPVARLLGEMRNAGIPDPARVVREVLAAGEVVRWPIPAWIAGVEPVTILWADKVWALVVVGNVVGDAEATGRAVQMSIDVEALSRELAGSGLPGGG